MSCDDHDPLNEGAGGKRNTNTTKLAKKAKKIIITNPDEINADIMEIHMSLANENQDEIQNYFSLKSNNIKTSWG